VEYEQKIKAYCFLLLREKQKQQRKKRVKVRRIKKPRLKRKLLWLNPRLGRAFISQQTEMVTGLDCHR
jgi:hypothetical protein